MKIAWFAIRERWFCDKRRTEVVSYPSNKKDLLTEQQKLRKDCQRVLDKGRELLRNNFK